MRIQLLGSGLPGQPEAATSPPRLTIRRRYRNWSAQRASTYVMPQILELKQLKPLAAGSTRLVFQHPSKPDLLVKVVRPERVGKRFADRLRPGTRLRVTQRRARQYIYYLREINEHLAMHARSEPDAYALTTLHGFAETDMGLGLVTRAVFDRDGRYAPTLAALIRQQRFTAAAQRNLETFIEQIKRSDILVFDLNATNIVYGHDTAHGDHFVLIDGIGEKTLIPVKAVSRLLNRYSKWKHIRRLREEIARLTAESATAEATRLASRDIAAPQPH